MPIMKLFWLPMVLTIATVVAASGQSRSAASNWPGFRGAAAGGIGQGAPPATWDLAKSVNVAWKTAVPGLAISSPIVWNDRIYLTTAVPMAPARGMDFRQRNVWKLLSLDRGSGRVLWEQVVHDAVPYMQRHPSGSYANATPVTDGQHVVAVFASEVLACFDPSGKLLWKKTMQVRSSRDAFQTGSSPVIVGETVVVQDDRDRDSSIAAYRLRDGVEVWRTPRADGPSQSTPAVWTGKDGRTLLVAVAEGSIRALDAATGKPVWGYPAKIAYGAGSVSIAGDLVVSSAGDDLYAFRAGATGTIKPIWSAPGNGAFIPSPIVVGDTVYVLNDNGVVSSFNLQTGKRLSQVRTTAGEFCASLVFADGKLYVFSGTGDASVLRVAPSLEVISRNAMGAGVQSTPAIVDGTLYVRTATHLVALRDSAKRSE